SGVVINNSSGNILGGNASDARNVISGNLNGVVIGGGSSGNTVAGNYIGTDVNGANAIPNGNNGIGIGQASNNMIGGMTAAARNVISGNGVQGIAITSSSQNVVEGNFIGTDATGTKALGNLLGGIILNGSAHDNTIGGSSVAARNVISGNHQVGIFIGSVGGASHNRVEGNFLGTDLTGAKL